MSKPITPAEVVQHQGKLFPDAVYETFNELIAKNWDGKRSEVKQKDAVELLIANMNWENICLGDLSEQYKRDYISLNHLLDIESVYRAAGWKVMYDKPGFNEKGEAHFVFSK